MRLVLFGPPGAGKGTQASMLSQRYNIVHVSTGDILRECINKNLDLGIKAKTYIDRGELVPDNIVIEIVKDRVNKSDCQNGYILDGFPRDIYQAREFDVFLENTGSKIDAVVYLAVDDNEIIERIGNRRVCMRCRSVYNVNSEKLGSCKSCGGDLILRHDDEKEVVKHRLTVYHEESQPLIEYYNAKKILLSIDGSNNENIVNDSIINALGSMII